MSDEQVKKALVALSIEKSLLDIGIPVFDGVTRQLYKRFKCYLPDCYEHPEYLRAILQELYGNSYQVIVQSIGKELEEFTLHKRIERFVKVLLN